MDDERPCTPLESLEQSLKEMRLMREGKMPKKSWWDYKREQKLEDKIKGYNIGNLKQFSEVKP